MAFLHEMPQDILDHILLRMPDFDTLAAALRTSKQFFYNIFQIHPNSIIHAIAWNIVGPALLQATRVACYQNTQELLDPQFESDLPQDRLTRNICATLHKNAAIIQKYENLFSLR